MTDQVSSIFVDQDESMTAVIGTSYLQNFMAGGAVEKSVGVLTQKRFYFKGQNFSGSGKHIQSTTEEGVVAIDDITFTEFTHTRYIGKLISAIVLAVLGLFLFSVASLIDGPGSAVIGWPGIALLGAALVFAVRFFTTRQSLFIIAFPGGSFGFDIRYYPIADMRDFQRQLHLLKDRRKENG